MKACSIDGCDAPVASRGWCERHRAAWRRHGDPLWERPKVCAVAACEAASYAKGWCVQHYGRWRAHGDPTTILTGRGTPLLDRFTQRYDVDASGCWLWTAGTSGNGYPRFAISHDKNVAAHRWSYEHFVGPIPEGFHVDHLCCVRLCVNPAHLQAVTPRENQLRSTGMGGLNAAKTHCLRGHEFTEENTLHVSGGRSCRECAKHRRRRSTASS